MDRLIRRFRIHGQEKELRAMYFRGLSMEPCWGTTREQKQSESGFLVKTSYSCCLNRGERVGGESIPDY